MMSDTKKERESLKEFIGGHGLTKEEKVMLATGEPEQLAPYGGRCEKCPAPIGVICEFPTEGIDCPVHAGQSD
jgi:hypothetical protein